MNRAAIRKALRLARRKEGVSAKEIPETHAIHLVALGLLRGVTLRVAISGAVLECRWKLTAAGHAWIDQDRETLPPPPGAEEETPHDDRVS